MKLRPSPKKMLLVISIVGVIFVVLTLIPVFVDLAKNIFNPANVILPGIIIGVSLIFSVVFFMRSYYILDNKAIVQQFLIKKKVYAYNDISYIDDIKSRRTKTLVMYMNNGVQVLLAMDEHCKLLYEVTSRCPNLLSRPEFLKKHPNVRL